MVETRSKKRKRQRLLQSYVPRRPDLPAIFESLNDDTLTTVLEFVGNKCYRSFGGLNYHCREIYISSGMTKKTFLFGYAPLSVIIDKIERAGYGWELVGKGVVLYNRRDVFEWAVQEQKKDVLKGICNVAAEEGRTDLLNKVWNNVEDWDEDKVDIFKGVYLIAAENGKPNVLKWYETKGLSMDKDWCAEIAARHGQLQILEWLIEEKYLELSGDLYNCVVWAAHYGQLHIMKWLREEKGLELKRELYGKAIKGGQLHVLKWLREQEVDWDDYTFHYAAQKGNLEILQWLHDEGCPWDDDDRYHRVREYWLKPEVIDWCRSNGYGNRIVFGGR